MGFSRKEVHYWLDTASNEQLTQVLESTEKMLSLTNNRDSISSMKWLRARIIEEINVRNELDNLK